MRNRFVTSRAPVRVALADVYARQHQALVDRKSPEPTLEELEASQARLEEAQAEGAWIDIKPELTAGETREFWARMMVTDSAVIGDPTSAQPRVQFRKVGFTKAAQYLLGWNLVDAAGVVEVPGGDDPAAVAARERLLELLDADTFAAISNAIEHHEAERSKRLNPTSAPAFAATSASHG